MSPSPDLIRELRSARPAAPAALRMRVREIAGAEAAGAHARLPRLRLPSRRVVAVAAPAAAALAIASAGALGLARSGSPPASTTAISVEKTPSDTVHGAATAPEATGSGASAQGSTAAAPGRAQQVSATLTVEVRDSDAVSKAAQDALDLTRSLGGYVVSSSVSTGDQGNATLTVRVPVAKVQAAIAGLSGLGRIVSQQVSIQDLQDSLDTLEKQEATLRGRIARVRARLATGSLAPETEAALRVRLQTLRDELVQVRGQLAATTAEARMSTIQVTLVTPGSQGIVAPQSRIHRTIDGALDVLAWEGIVLLGLVIVLAPLAVAGLVAWAARRLYRRREEERLLAT